MAGSAYRALHNNPEKYKNNRKKCIIDQDRPEQNMRDDADELSLTGAYR